MSANRFRYRDALRPSTLWPWLWTALCVGAAYGLALLTIGWLLAGCTSLGDSEEDARALRTAEAVFAVDATDPALGDDAQIVAFDAWCYAAWVRWRVLGGELPEEAREWVEGLAPGE